MAAKTITGSYPGGYYLKPNFATLEIGSSAYVGGTGVTTRASAASAIVNLGTVIGARDGVSLADGGKITNGSAVAEAALIQGVTPITVDQGAGSLINHASIVSTGVVGGYLTTYSASVAFNAGGSILNEPRAVISHGVSVGGTAGTLVNYGAINGAGSYYDRTPSPGYRYTSSTIVASVEMSAGGQVINGSATHGTAKLANGVSISGAAGSVANYGAILGPSNYSYTGEFRAFAYERSSYQAGPAVTLSDGGGVTNGSPSDGSSYIAGVDISGAVGSVSNFGSINGPKYKGSLSKVTGFAFHYYYDSSTWTRTGWAIQLADGGQVTNGSAADDSATLGDGVSISGSAGLVVNYGRIDGPNYSSQERVGNTSYGRIYGPSYSSQESAAALPGDTAVTLGVDHSIFLDAGGTVVNGAGGVTTASISDGVFITGGIGAVMNNGVIGYADGSYYPNVGAAATHNFGYSVALDAGGVLGNGSATNAGGLIENGVRVSGGTGTVTNFGTIEIKVVGSTGATTGVNLKAGGLIVNGSASDATASISGVTGISISGAGTVTNFGTIASNAGAGGVAIAFGATSDRLVEEGSGVLVGQVAAVGGVLELAAGAGAGTIGGLGSTITGFSTITVDAGAGWHLSGANTIVAGQTMTTASGITETGTLTNDGLVSAGAIIELAGSSELDNAATGKLLLTNNAGISPAAGAAATTLVNAGTLQASSTGTSIVRVNVTNTGVIAVTSGTLRVTGSVTGAGTVRIGNATADFTAAFSEHVTFTAGSTGELQLSRSQSFTGTVSGLASSGANALDLVDISFIAGTTKATYSGTATSGTLSVTSGTHTAKIKLLGDYLGSTFTLASDGDGGTLVRDPAAPATHPLVAAMASFAPAAVDGGATLDAASRPQGHALAIPA